MKCLFIGGPKAGQMLDVTPGIPKVRIPVLPSGRHTDIYDRSNLSVGFSDVMYELDFATDKSGNRHALYVLEGSGDPLVQLMEFYAASKHS